MTLLVVFLLFVFVAFVCFAIAAALVFMLAIGLALVAGIVTLGFLGAFVGTVLSAFSAASEPSSRA